MISFVFETVMIELNMFSQSTDL